MAAQILQVAGAEVRLLHPVQQPLQPGVDAVAGLVLVVVGVAAEVMVKLHFQFMQPHAVVELRHRELVLVGE